MRVLIAICTYNRANLLRETLSCLESLHKPPNCVLGVLVVNNCCKDNTDSVVEEFKSKLPILLAHEEKPGLSNARNRAANEAIKWEADYIIWTDDDVRPYPDWLESYCVAYLRHPQAAVFGGPVEPWFEVEPPQWISENWENLRFAFAVRDLGTEESELDAEKGLPFGANYSLRTTAQAKWLYDPKLGVSRGKRLAGEETVVMRAILSEGDSGWWLPNARVRHFIERERLTLRYITKYFYGAGASSAIVRSDSSSRLFDRPRWMYRNLVEKVLVFGGHLLLFRRKELVTDYTNMLFAMGQLSTPSEGSDS